MQKTAYRTWADIDLDALAGNMKEIRRHVGNGVKIIATVKADAYGHGALQATKVFLENGADYLAVSNVDEAQQLRMHNITAPILLLGYTSKADVTKIVLENLMPAVFSYEQAQCISEIAGFYKHIVKIHIKLDTGMHRIGFDCSDESVEEVVKISKLKNIEIEGMFTHFSCADGDDDSYTHLQFERFMDFNERLKKKGIKIKFKHVCNSAALMKHKEMHLDMVRPGIICYGLYPSPLVDKSILKLLPAMCVKTIVSRIQYISGNEIISYGGTFRTTGKTKVATIPIGYADGLYRLLSNKWSVIVGGKYADIIGNICMDQCMIDVTDVNNINVEDEVIVFGNSADKSATFDAAADILGTINYELICAIGKRVPRVYCKNGKITDILSYLV